MYSLPPSVERGGIRIERMLAVVHFSPFRKFYASILRGPSGFLSGCTFFPYQEKRTDALLANGISGHVELTAELHGRLAIQNVTLTGIPNVADRMVKKARTHRAIRFDHSRDPGRVAVRGHILRMPEDCPVMQGDSAQLLRTFRNEPRFDFPLTLPYQRADLQVESSNFRRVQGNAFLARRRPAEGTVESFRCCIGRKK